MTIYIFPPMQVYFQNICITRQYLHLYTCWIFSTVILPSCLHISLQAVVPLMNLTSLLVKQVVELIILYRGQFNDMLSTTLKISTGSNVRSTCLSLSEI